MKAGKPKRNWIGQRRWWPFRVDGLLLIFLLAGWLLIFTSATLGLQRSSEGWLPLQLVSRISADYSVDSRAAPRFAPVRGEVIEAVRQDALAARPSPSSTPSATATDEAVSLAMLIFGRTPTPTPTTTPTPLPLQVSAGGPYAGEEGSPLHLAVQGPGEAITYRWDLDGDGQYDDAVGVSTTVVFNDDGEYRVSVQAIDALGQVTVDDTTVSVSNVIPMVDAGKDKSASEGQKVSFAATASDPGDDVLSYKWDFGDGVGAKDTLDPQHTYVNDGDYRVTLIVEDGDGGVGEASFVVHIDNVPPSADAGPDHEINQGETVTFNGAATDPGVLDELSYAWDFDYDGVTFTVDDSGRTVSHTYSTGLGALTAALRVDDGDGGQAIATAQVLIDNIPPKIDSVAHNGPGKEGSPVTLVVSASDAGGDALTYLVDWENDGDFEVIDDVVGQEARATHTWPDEGSYTVGIQVDDGTADTSTTINVPVDNVPPVAAVVPLAATFEGSSVTLSGAGSYDPGVLDVLTYEWDFGDGASVTNPPGVDSANHTYVDNGNYNVTLTVRDDSNAVSTATASVAILNADPVVAIRSGNSVNEGQPFTFEASASDPGAGDTWQSLEWDFDYDGTNFEVDKSGGTSVSHKYPDGPATPVVAFRARDDDYPCPSDRCSGEPGEGMDTLQITVKNVAPVARAGGPYTSHPTRPITLTGTAEDVAGDVTGEQAYRWDLDNDGRYNDAVGSTVITTWATIGTYTVTLRVTDKDGDQGVSTTHVTIGNQDPIVRAGGPYSGTQGIPITLRGTASDPDVDLLTYEWNFGDGSPVANELVVDHTYAERGTYTAVLRVADPWGGVVTDTAQVHINGVPTANAGWPYDGTEGSPIRLNGTASDPDNDPLTYTWDFGDGQGATGTLQPEHIYTAAGDYTVTLVVEDGRGGRASDSAQVHIADNSPPTANAGGPYTGIEDSSITLNGTGSDPEGDPLTYEWDFDDGSPLANGATVDHTYADNGTYVATLRVADTWGGEGTSTATVTVDNKDPTANAGGPYATTVDTTLTLRGSASDAPADSLTYIWDLDDDGNFETEGQDAFFTSSMTGTFRVVLRVEDDDGGFDEAETTVQVDALLPVAGLGGVYLLAGRKQVVSRRRRLTRTEPSSHPLPGKLAKSRDGNVKG